ncbi:protein RTE1-HOMOLOG-like isoform X1 [Ananas comosus]|uniref:Protein RTE1-HOMOLOG-like isoform X1 n=1 Tax=Ananas comosus TaxID=4615 RepID=A0A6P5FRB3_ANACO|nr:protein RTE1-HOMOLOG-like isoform X1 [Ananas comosus]XP_020095601.1 protein RTE1-HOMOLOG-like isoform X1 [Ananas comosus]XP_020095602.1 protein RTE1-HOMOLOG-like isoform X1 [Ananas comosus]XP_020095603.1 protein RTE1-HOMOLOG-like isoform X1 [Ananas comosus]XP_020095605.1 protein RTE1-HOMOLOG-like isoform X1 [Ananas comosus]XP_020095606.1 protein RTE1-HOMOLOG-like isoform X1 [Ananas comosus]
MISITRSSLFFRLQSESLIAKMMLTQNAELGPIDPRRARFPCCIVWTPLPLISWLIPFIGHIGICREDGVILDFAGPNFVSVDNFAFGAVARYIQINGEECYKLIEPESDIVWDDALKKSTQEFQHRSYNLFTCNCHSFVANNLNRLFYGGHDKWNVVNLAAVMFLRGTWVGKASMVKSFLPFVIVLCIGLFLGGMKFLVFVLAFALALVGWFFIGTYCFKNLIQL